MTVPPGGVKYQAGRSERFLLIDALRIVAITLVISSHLLISMGPAAAGWNQLSIGNRYINWKTWGEVGVTLFLVVSGMSLELRYGRANVPFRDFVWRRIIRIYPVYYFSLVLAVCVSAAFALWGALSRGTPVAWPGHVDVAAILLTLSGFNAFAGRWGGSLVWSSWFIGLIMSLYLLFPLISRLLKWNLWAGGAALLALSSVSRFVTVRFGFQHGNPLEWFPLNRVFEFGCGVLLVQALGRSALLQAGRPFAAIPFLQYFSALSFPLFLIHDPLRRFIDLGGRGAPATLFGVLTFLVLSVGLSSCALAIDGRIACRRQP